MEPPIPLQGWKAFLTLCTTLNSTEEFDRIFDLFLTIEEKNLLASRALIVKELLEEKKSQREIAKTYHVSIAQITRGSNALKRMDSSTKKFLKTSLFHWWR